MFSFLHLLKLSTPLRPVRRLDQGRCLLLRLGHGTRQVAAAHAKLDSDEAISLLAIDRRGPRTQEVSLRIRVALRVYRRDQVAQTLLRRPAPGCHSPGE